MSAYKTNAEQIEEIEEKRKKLARQLQELKRKEEQRNAVKYRRIGKIFLENFTDLTIDDVSDNDEEVSELVNKIMSEAMPQHDENIERRMRQYIDSHEFGRKCTNENGETYAERFDFTDLLVRGDDGQYYHFDLPDLIARYSI